MNIHEYDDCDHYMWSTMFVNHMMWDTPMGYHRIIQCPDSIFDIEGMCGTKGKKNFIFWESGWVAFAKRKIFDICEYYDEVKNINDKYYFYM